jgi:hypothetical protein
MQKHFELPSSLWLHPLIPQCSCQLAQFLFQGKLSWATEHQKQERAVTLTSKENSKQQNGTTLHNHSIHIGPS